MNSRESNNPQSEMNHDLTIGSQNVLREVPAGKLSRRRPKRKKSDDIAIVGMAGIFPKASDLRRYWENIINGLDAVEEVPPSRWNADEYFSEDRFARDKVYSKWGGFLGDMVFDPMEWKIPPSSMYSIDMIQLMALEVASRAMQDAGYDRRDFPRETTGVLFAVAGSHEIGTDYCFRTMLRHYLPRVEGLSDEVKQQIYSELDEKLPEWTEDSFPGFLLNVIAGRIANRLDLRGPNYVVDAACAASLAALHAGIEQLRSRTSDMMLVGAADATNNPFCYMSFAKTHALSPGGRSRPFDDSADGIALGEAVATVVLKRLKDAERDGDKIYAVIKGIGSSSDGKNRSLTAPCPDGQVQALKRAYKDAGVNPATVSLIEAHGTGTAVGDSTEISSLTTMFEASGSPLQQAAIGSVKSMIGHTKTAAGLCSLVKTALALKHHVLPPTLGVEKPNTRVDFSQSPFYVNSETRPWIEETSGAPRRAGVSAFGFGGTNFHVVLEEYTGKNRDQDDVNLTPRASEVLIWQRSNRTEIRETLSALDSRLSEHVSDDLAQLAYSVVVNEREREGNDKQCRLAIVADSVDDLKAKVKRALASMGDAAEWSDPTGIYYRETKPVTQSELCFLYPGQGSQSKNMLRDLTVASGWSHDLFAAANRLIGDRLPKSLSRYIYPCPEFDEQTKEQHQSELNDTRVTQPALGLVELYATRLMERFGITPGMTAGHSYGEYVALHAAGALSWEDMLNVSAHRGRISAEISEKSSGAMAAVAADAETTRAALADISSEIQLANINGPKQTIIAGPAEDIDKAVTQLSQKGLRSKRIPVTAAFHTKAMQPGADELATVLEQVTVNAPKLPIYSNTSAGLYPADPAGIRKMLARQFTEPVQFEQEIQQIHADGGRVFIEVGPGRVLTGLVGSILKDTPHTALSLDAPGRNGWTQFGHLLAGLATLGVPVEIDAWFAGRGLQALTTDELFEKTKADNQRKPCEWILNPSSATPVTPLARRKPSGDALRSKFAKKTVAVKPQAAVAVAQALTPSPAPMPAATGNGVLPQPAIPANPSSSRVVQSPQSRGPVAGPAAMPHPSTNVPPPRSIPTNTPRSAQISSRTSNASSGRVEIGSVMTPEQVQMQQGARGPMSSHVNADFLSQMQFTMSQWLDLQRSQQRVTERFLDMQERILQSPDNGQPVQPSAYLWSTPTATPPVAFASSPVLQQQVLAAPAPQAAPMPAPAAAVTAPPVPSAPAPRPAPVAVPAAVRPPVPIPVEAATPKPIQAAPVAVQPAKAPAPAPVAPSTPTVAPAASAAATDGPPTTEQFRNDLLEAVSERTGYPVDMLDETLPLESGLGIDSIKTVEIFSNLKTYHAYFRQDGQDEEELLTEFTKLKTLGDIVHSYDTHRQAFLPSNGSANGKHVEASHTNGNGHGRGNGSTQGLNPPVERRVLEAVEVGGPSESEKKNSRLTT